MKFYLVILGFFAIAVPERKGGPVEILFLNPANQRTTLGTLIPRHELHLFHYTRPEPGNSDSPPVLMDLHWEKPLTIRVGGNEPVVLRNQEGFLDLTSVVSAPEPLRLRSECTGSNALENCRINGEPVLGARLIIGGGNLQPVEVLGAEISRTPGETLAMAKWAFRPLGGSLTADAPSRPTFNGVLFEMEIPANSDEVVLGIGDFRLPLRPQQLPACRSLAPGGSSECFLVRIENNVHALVLTASEILETINQRFTLDLRLGNNGGAHQHSRPTVDEHFELVYSLLSNAPARERWLVPHFEGEESPPESRCIPPMLLLPDEAR